MSKVNVYFYVLLCFEFVLYHLVICKLSSIVECNTLDLVSWDMCYESRENTRESYGILSEWKFSNEYLSCFSLNKSEYSS